MSSWGLTDEDLRVGFENENLRKISEIGSNTRSTFNLSWRPCSQFSLFASRKSLANKEPSQEIHLRGTSRDSIGRSLSHKYRLLLANILEPPHPILLFIIRISKESIFCDPFHPYSLKSTKRSATTIHQVFSEARVSSSDHIEKSVEWAPSLYFLVGERSCS